MQERNRSKPHSFDDKIAAEKARAEAQLSGIEHGPEREAIARKIRQLETASHVNEWLSSPGLRSPD
jgi:hypothetical protein